MAEQREAVVFENRDGLRLFGILHRPKGALEREVGVILLCPGIKSRVAPHRLYVKMAQFLVDQGFPVLRFDFFGIGDSEGELLEEQLADYYRSVQDGRYIDDTVCAIDWMGERLGLQKFVLAGLCGGALTALLAAAHDPRAEGVLALGLPVALGGLATDPSRFMSRGQLDKIGGSYLKKAVNLKAWIRFFTLKTDYRMLWRAIRQHLFGRDHLMKRRSAENLKSNLNPLIPPAFSAFLSKGGRLLLIFSGGDRLIWEFDEKFAQPYSRDLRSLRTGFEVHVIPDANHILSDPKWRSQMESICDAWMARHF